MAAGQPERMLRVMLLVQLRAGELAVVGTCNVAQRRKVTWSGAYMPDETRTCGWQD